MTALSVHSRLTANGARMWAEMAAVAAADTRAQKQCARGGDAVERRRPHRNTRFLWPPSLDVRTYPLIILLLQHTHALPSNRLRGNRASRDRPTGDGGGGSIRHSLFFIRPPSRNHPRETRFAFIFCTHSAVFTRNDKNHCSVICLATGSLPYN